MMVDAPDPPNQLGPNVIPDDSSDDEDVRPTHDVGRNGDEDTDDDDEIETETNAETQRNAGTGRNMPRIIGTRSRAQEIETPTVTDPRASRELAKLQFGVSFKPNEDAPR